IENSKGNVKVANSAQMIHHVISPEIARRIRRIMKRSIKKNVIKAHMNYYTAADKTGTPQKIDPKTDTYSHNKHLATFTGIAPNEDPHLVIYVQINEPKHKLDYEAIWAAPVF